MNEDVRERIVGAIETHKKMTAAVHDGGVDVIAAIAEVITVALEADGTV